MSICLLYQQPVVYKRGFSQSASKIFHIFHEIFIASSFLFYLCGFFFSVICACPHRTNVFIFSAVFDPLGTRFYLASDKRESFRRHLFKIILTLSWGDYLWGFSSSCFSQSSKESCESFPSSFFASWWESDRKKREKTFRLACSSEAEGELRLLVDNANIEPKPNGKNLLANSKRVSCDFSESFSLNFHSQIHFNSVNYRNLNISVRSGQKILI